jgi:hypothetical protein
MITLPSTYDSMHPATADSGARAATRRANDEDGRTGSLNIGLAQGHEEP